MAGNPGEAYFRVAFYGDHRPVVYHPANPTGRSTILFARKFALSMKLKTKGKNSAILLGVIALLFALGLLSTIIKDVAHARQSVKWPSANGEILESRLSEAKPGKKAKLRSRKAVIYYRYTVGDKEYKGDKPVFGATTGLTAQLGLTRSAKDLIRKYPKEKKVEVFHHPDHPEIAVLETGVNREVLVPVCFGIVFSFAGGIVIRRAIRNRGEPVAASGRDNMPV